jgi:hypothetical protein
MKKSLFICLFVIQAFFSCQNNIVEADSTKQESDQNIEWKFSKEVLIKNEESSALLMLHSNYEDSINYFLEGIDISLNLYGGNEDVLAGNSLITHESVGTFPNDYGKSTFNEPSIVIEHLGVNLANDIYSYSITFAPKNLKSPCLLPMAVHETYKRFIGIVTEDDGGVDLWVRFSFKLNLLSSWAAVAIPSQTPRPGHRNYPCPFDTYKMRMAVHRDTEDNVYPTYSVYEIVRDYQKQGKNCLMGTFASSNCYVGSAPNGTSAFIYDNKFYYTPVNGSQCPLPGSNFDGANCYVANVPTYAFPLIWNNSWYIEPYLDDNLFGFTE